MKRSVIVHNSYQGIYHSRQNFDIPKCQSFQQFFSLKHPRKRRRNQNLYASMTIDHSRSQSRLSVFDIRNSSLTNFSQKTLLISDALTCVTDCSDNTEMTINFKKREDKVRPNRTSRPIIDFQKNREENLVRKAPSLKIPILSIPDLCKKKPSMQKQRNKWSIEDFVLIKKIGEGSYSEVYLAVEKNSSFVCALKKLRKQSIRQNKLLHVVIRQLKIHHYLNHKNISGLYGEFDDNDHIYLITQYCTNGDLHKLIKQNQKLGQQIEVSLVRKIVKQICQAVGQMHKDYLMHRDIKPQNIFLTMGNVVKLGDFGWSVYNGDHGLRNTQCGTPLYLAPQLVQNHEYSQSIDIWAIGVLTYELLTGQIPFKIKGVKDLTKILNQNIKFEYIEDQEGRDFVMKLLQRDIKLRMEIQDVLEHPFLNTEKND